MIELPSVTPASFRKYLLIHRDRVYRYVIREIDKAVDAKLSSVQLFRINKKDTFELKEHNYSVILETAMAFFVEKELYEDAAICRDILTKIKQDDMMKGEKDD